ncbi:MAG: ferredoxin [Pseudonocardia sp. SCN 72-86]|nr:MAG: ferredoxin [Pseudonocardia sp. SCN 72-86]
MAYVISEGCIDVKDRACVEECPVDCIYEGPRMLYINPEECIDCGACEPTCPQSAIFYEDDLPADAAHYRTVNAEVFVGISTAGNASDSGPLAADHELVATARAR